jgi:hypothetical protein
MATTYYSNPNGSNTAPYNTIAKGATNPATVEALLVAGDTHYLVAGTYTLAAPFVPGVSGSAGLVISMIGVNASGVDDGSQAIFDGGATQANCIAMTSARPYRFYKNISCTRAAGNGVSGAGSGWMFNQNQNYVTLYNCKAYLNANCGFDNWNGYIPPSAIKCESYSNTKKGYNQMMWGPPTSIPIYGCVARLNGLHGFYSTGGGTSHINCLSYGNVGYGFASSSVVQRQAYIGCVSFGNTTGGGYSGTGFYCENGFGAFICLMFCRAVGNQSYGIDAQAAGALYAGGGNVIVNNGAGQVNTAVINPNNLFVADVTTGTDDGMIDSAHNNFMEKTPVAGKINGLVIDANGNTIYRCPGIPFNPDFPTAANTLDTDTTDGQAGTKDHLEIYKATDSTDPGVANVNVDVVASYKINGATLTPTLSVNASNTAYENGRNSGGASSKIVQGQAIVQKGTTYNGNSADLTAADTAFLALEDLRNTLTENGAADVLEGSTWLHLGEELVGTLLSGGGGALAGKLNVLIKLLVNKELLKEIPEGSGNWFLVNYDDDDTAILRKSALKTLEGVPFVPDPASGEVARREKSLVTAAPTPLSGCLREKIDKLIKHAFNNLSNVEMPTGSGKYYRILKDDDDRAILAKNPLKTVLGAEISSLKNRGDINQRLKSEV